MGFSGAQVVLAIISQVLTFETSTKMKVLALLLTAVPALNALCLINSCDSYWSGAQAKLKKDGACAVLFDENCCKGSGLKDDIEALFVMPGCKLEVWDHGSGLEDAVKEERKGFNQGDYKNMKDLYDQNKLVFRADRTKPHWVEEINDDFDDMDEDIESFRCTCN